MGDKVTKERTVATRTVDGVDFEIVELSWRDGGVCYDVVRAGTQNLINNESFDKYPTDDEIRDLAQLTWEVTYMITAKPNSKMLALLSAGSVTVHAPDEEFAKQAAIEWIENNDPLHDERIDPIISIVDVKPIEGK